MPEPMVSPSSAPQLYLNTGLTVQASRLSLNNKDYLVAPAVLVVAGVLNGALVPEDALEADVWNGMPVTIGHPRDHEGNALSARSPEVLAAVGIGSLYHARLGQGQRAGQAVRSLQAELWLDMTQVHALGGEALQAMQMLETQERLEVSTGFFATALPQLGTFYGAPYTEILYDVSPDHLALLPNTIGACDWSAGCGAPRMCERQSSGCDASQPCAACAAERTAMAAPPEPTRTRWQAFVAMLRQFVQDEPVEGHTTDPALAALISTETIAPLAAVPLLVTSEMPQPVLVTAMTDGDVRESLYSCLACEMGTDYTYIFIDSIDTATQTFVYRQGERLVQRGWQLDSAGVISLDSTAQDVQRDTRFLPVPGAMVEPDDLASDSHQDIPAVMAAHSTTPRCSTCQSFLIHGPHAGTTLCPQCTPPEAFHQESMPMTTPAVSPVAIRARVNNLIMNKQYGWAERDRSLLEAMPEATLIRLESQPIIVPVEPPAVVEPPKTAEDAIAGMPVHLQDMFTQMHREHQGRRQAALAILIAHSGCPFTQEELQEMSVERLEKLVAMGAGVEYSGRGLPAPRPTPEVFESPPPPPDTLNLVIARQKAQGLR